MKSCRGFTLMELVLASVLIGLVGLGFAAISGTAQTYLSQSAGISNVQGEASYAMLHMKKYLSVANRVIQYNAGGNPPQSTRLAFRYDHRGLSGTPLDISDDNWDYYAWDATNKTIVYRQGFVTSANPGSTDPADPGPDGATVVARNIQSLLFTLTNSIEVDIDLTAQQTVGPQSRSTRVSTSVTPRGWTAN